MLVGMMMSMMMMMMIMEGDDDGDEVGAIVKGRGHFRGWCYSARLRY